MIKINCSINDLTKDIKRTCDPLKKAILQKFIDIKTNEMINIHEDTYIHELSESMKESDTENERHDPTNNQSYKHNNGTINQTKNKTNNKTNNKINNKKNIIYSENDDQNEIKSILKRQENGLIELDKANKKKAYEDLLNENNKENDKNIIQKIRGKGEERWNNDTLYDSQYTKYVKEDLMNNKLMERLNTEIDFRHNNGKKIQIQKPFDENKEENIIESFARFEPMPNISKKERKKPKQQMSNKQLGQRRSLYQ